MDVAETIETPKEEPLAPDLSHLITEDDKPVDTATRRGSSLC